MNAKRKKSYIPPRSPHGLLQEDLYPNEWKCLVVCIMLNCTTRRQIEKVIPQFFQKWPTPKLLLEADREEVAELISFLGFRNRRTDRLFKMSASYVEGKWQHAKELPGIGEYASRMWEIFFLGELGEDPPNDGALLLYWKWRLKLDRDFLSDHEFFDGIRVDEECEERSSTRDPRTETDEVAVAVERTAA